MILVKSPVTIASDIAQPAALADIPSVNLYEIAIYPTSDVLVKLTDALLDVPRPSTEAFFEPSFIMVLFERFDKYLSLLSFDKILPNVNIVKLS